MQRRLITLLAIAALAIGLAACGSSSKNSSSGGGASGGSAGSGTITIDSSFTFSAASVPAGSTVTVKNNSSAQHTVTEDTGGGFNVTIDAGKTATFTAPSTPGTYKYHCNIHSFMHGTLTVT
jgi:plastocyanin